MKLKAPSKAHQKTLKTTRMTTLTRHLLKGDQAQPRAKKAEPRAKKANLLRGGVPKAKLKSLETKPLLRANALDPVDQRLDPVDQRLAKKTAAFQRVRWASCPTNSVRRVAFPAPIQQKRSNAKV